MDRETSSHYPAESGGTHPCPSEEGNDVGKRQGDERRQAARLPYKMYPAERNTPTERRGYSAGLSLRLHYAAQTWNRILIFPLDIVLR